MTIGSKQIKMSGYKKYNGLDYRPKFSSSEKGRSREVHYILGKIGGSGRGRRRKSDISLEDMNEVASILFSIVALIIWGTAMLFVWMFKITKKNIVQYREKKRSIECETNAVDSQK